MKLQESAENYLENIYILQQRIGDVRSIDLATEMGFSKPSVSRAVHLLADNGYISIEDSGFLVLTERGMDVAKKIYDRHTFLLNYFISLGVDKDTAAEDACAIEHYLSDESFEKMRNHINHCAFECPQNTDVHFFQFNKNCIEGKRKQCRFRIPLEESADDADEQNQTVDQR